MVLFISFFLYRVIILIDNRIADMHFLLQIIPYEKQTE
jgi:hypothetical protein